MEGQATPDNQSSSAPAPAANETKTVDVIPEVVDKISEAHNILVALSSDPSVDEMAAAIGLSIYLDKLGKRATAIYSGSTPNALEFLNPEETFEPTADTLQDFVIALNKDKADHLRYKLDGDFVKIYITPYRTRINEEDLEYTYGDFNVDLVLALDVANGIDLDSALREHGRIMHDAVIINITTGNPGKFGEIEWSDKEASSVSEMIAKLLYSINGKVKIEKEEATAFLTGIVAATNRFSKANTTSETMKISSRLMESGANQQLISKNITPDLENQMFSMSNAESRQKSQEDQSNLEIKHGKAEESEESKDSEESDETDTASEKDNSLLDDLKAAEASLSQAGAETTPVATTNPIKITNDGTTTPTEPVATVTAEPDTASVTTSADIATTALESASSDPTTQATPGEPVISTPPVESMAPVGIISPSEAPVSTEPNGSMPISDKPEKVLQPSSDFASDVSENTNKYGQMLEAALAGIDSNSAPAAPISPDVAAPSVNPVTVAPDINPAAEYAPAVPVNPEINGVPEINYMPMPGDEVLPPPPTPPIAPAMPDSIPVAEPSVPSSEPTVAPTATAVEPVKPVAPTETAAPAAPITPVEAPASTDPSAFKIPGM